MTLFNRYTVPRFLLDWTGRIIRDDKRGDIENTLPPILDRLEITADQWRMNTTQFEALQSHHSTAGYGLVSRLCPSDQDRHALATGGYDWKSPIYQHKGFYWLLAPILRAGLIK